MKRVSWALLVLSVTPAVAPLGAQSLMYRAPDLGGTWVSEAGVVQFNFVHRFHVFPGPANAVVNYSAFTLAAGVATTSTSVSISGPRAASRPAVDHPTRANGSSGGECSEDRKEGRASRWRSRPPTTSWRRAWMVSSGSTGPVGP